MRSFLAVPAGLRDSFCCAGKALTASARFVHRFRPWSYGALSVLALGAWGGPDVFKAAAVGVFAVLAGVEVGRRFKTHHGLFLSVLGGAVIAHISFADLSVEQKMDRVLRAQAQEAIVQGAEDFYAEKPFEKKPFWGWNTVHGVRSLGMIRVEEKDNCFTVRITANGEEQTEKFCVRPAEYEAASVVTKSALTKQ